MLTPEEVRSGHWHRLKAGASVTVSLGSNEWPTQL